MLCLGREPLFLKLFMCMAVLPVHMFLVTVEAKIGSQSPWICSYPSFPTTTWVLQTDPGSSARAASTLNCRERLFPAAFPKPLNHFLLYYSLGTSSILFGKEKQECTEVSGCESFQRERVSRADNSGVWLWWGSGRWVESGWGVEETVLGTSAAWKSKEAGGVVLPPAWKCPLRQRPETTRNMICFRW